jgi:hypothetical protein
VCHPNKCRAHWDHGILYTSCRSTSQSGTETITTERVWIDADGNLQLDGRIVVQGVTATMHSTYMKQVGVVFDLGERTRN